MLVHSVVDDSERSLARGIQEATWRGLSSLRTLQRACRATVMCAMSVLSYNTIAAMIHGKRVHSAAECVPHPQSCPQSIIHILYTLLVLI